MQNASLHYFVKHECCKLACFVCAEPACVNYGVRKFVKFAIPVQNVHRARPETSRATAGLEETFAGASDEKMFEL